jgi:hypothetical protein
VIIELPARGSGSAHTKAGCSGRLLRGVIFWLTRYLSLPILVIHADVGETDAIRKHRVRVEAEHE